MNVKKILLWKTIYAKIKKKIIARNSKSKTKSNSNSIICCNDELSWTMS